MNREREAIEIDKVDEKMKELAEVEDLTDDLLQDVQMLKQIVSGVHLRNYYTQRNKTRRTFRKLMKKFDSLVS